MRPRNAELSLVILALVVAFGTGALTDLARGDTLTPELFRTVGLFSLIALAGHVAIRRFAPAADPILYGIAVLLSGFGLGMIRRLDEQAETDPLAVSQLGWIAVGVAAFALTLAVIRDHRTLEQFRYSLMLVGIGLLLLPLTPIGTDLGRNVRLWVQVGPINFQPAEAAKIVLALFVAGYLASKREVMTITSARIGPIGFPAPRHFGPLLLAWGLSLAVMFYEKDLGSSLLFFGLFVVTAYVATSQPSYVVVGGGLAIAGVWFAYTTFSHVQSRVSAWLDPWIPCKIVGSGCRGFEGDGYQIAQSWYALGAGGLTGTGLGKGHPGLIDPGADKSTLPTDFIFAAIGEELGMIGAVAILMLFGLLVARGMHIALRSRDPFGSLLATGLTAIIGLQTILIVGGVTRLVPLTGITLPFTSYGGSSLLANFVLIALLMRISDGEAVG